MVTTYETGDNTAGSGPEEETMVQQLAKTIMEQDTFVATTDNGQLYWFNGKIYLQDQEWIIKKKCRLLLPKVTSHDIQEVINYIRDLNYIDRSQFDSNPESSSR